MTLTTSFTVGDLQCHTLDAGRLRLDGGAMFGVVPKPLWSRKIPADDRNRIPLAMRCLLIEHDDGLILVDTGLGNKEADKFRDIYGVENQGTHGPTQLEDALHELGFASGDVRTVINTHLHFDHCGGNTFLGAGGADPQPAFPNARYVVQNGELAFSETANERTAASYLPLNIGPVTAAKRWRTVDGETEVVPGIVVVPTPGHTPYHQSVLIRRGGETACFLADLAPTTAHAPLPWIMGYDLEPLVTLESKRALFAAAEADSWQLIFEHDPVCGRGRLARDGKAYVVEPEGP